jgi:hypothetical protein
MRTARTATRIAGKHRASRTKTPAEMPGFFLEYANRPISANKLSFNETHRTRQREFSFLARINMS